MLQRFNKFVAIKYLCYTINNINLNKNLNEKQKT